MRRHRYFIGLLFTLVVILSGLLLSSAAIRASRSDEMREKQAVASMLGLTDLAVWTEARYTRHPSQADFFTPFQDGPATFEHFPAGAVVAPAGPATTMRR